VTVWTFAGEGPEGTTPGRLAVHTLPVTSLAFARRGRVLASGGREGGVVLWRLYADGDGAPVGGDVVQGAVAELAWRHDDRALAATDAEGGVTTWRVSW
jgi:WD40 repeat protein